MERNVSVACYTDTVLHMMGLRFTLKLDFMVLRDVSSTLSMSFSNRRTVYQRRNEGNVKKKLYLE